MINQELLQLLAKGKTKIVLARLLEVEPVAGEIILLSGRLKTSWDLYAKGGISYDKYQEEQNQINFILLNFLEDNEIVPQDNAVIKPSVEIDAGREPVIDYVISTPSTKVGAIVENTHKFKFNCKEVSAWTVQNNLRLHEHLAQVGLGVGGSDGFDYREWENTLSLTQFGRMQCHADILLLQQGDDHELDIDYLFSTEAVEDAIRRIQKLANELEDVSELEEGWAEGIRAKFKQEFHDNVKDGKVRFKNYFMVATYNKLYEEGAVIQPDIHKFFQRLIKDYQPQIEKIESTQDSIVFVSKENLYLQDTGDVRPFTIYRIAKLLEKDENLYLVEIQWSPNFGSSVDTWKELKYMFDSFTLF